MTERANVIYASEPDLDVAEFRRVLVESGLGALRPVDDEQRLRHMLSGANLVVTARLDSRGRPLIGIGRGVSDGAWACYLADLAVCPSAQGLGVGRGLLDEARRQLGPQVSLILVSVPEAVGFYERAGMERLSTAFWYKREH
ncbi:ribosomal protein S18 acetylase RimI-like enzyme [Mesorhizobium soli]|jgi:ribosomal protein S18 acetylase RimI-like enzyme|uniref:GNAT family N-acetyltransferase n=1 Tax=Pseudaminobacter soli (ex Li et al. 2025) TaxID=1295366 RepID=UPI0024753D95|nr:GNAT family N-acetyltransferase [Mesorhizobium soli]MDH6234224.1 ribosomal protein S18 acetylase RimI-like enzyme [Mesorhizobium soli]